MKMNNKLICLPIVMAFTSLLVVTNSGFIFFPKPPITRPTTAAIDVRPTTTARPTTAAITILSTSARTNTTRSTTLWTSTTGFPAQNLNGKMFTLSSNRGGISFFPPNYSPNAPPQPSSTLYPTSGSTNSPWTTAAPPRGVSVCLRYLTDNGRSSPTIFTLSPSSRFPLKLVDNSGFSYNLYFDSYYPQDSLYFNPNIRLWSGMRLEAWTRVCVTMDTVKKVAQVFKGPNMSIRKRLPSEYVWSGQPVIDFSGFDGQVTDVQVWDYPLRYKEVFYYMTRSDYEPYSGSVLTWSSISYSARGDALLEDAYEWQSEQPIRRRGRRPKGEQKSREVFDWGEKRGSRKKL